MVKRELLSISAVIIVIILMVSGCMNWSENEKQNDEKNNDQADNSDSDQTTEDTDTTSNQENDSNQNQSQDQGNFTIIYVSVDPWGVFDINPNDITTIRPDIFKPGHFSIFDVILYLNSSGTLTLSYHFDKALDTHVIDELNGQANWWYIAYYDGGWAEWNVFRMDYYPVKDKMTIDFYEEDPTIIADKYAAFESEVERKAANDGKIIIPTVIIDGETFEETFLDVEVTAHNLRNDTFQDGVITAIDVIMSLGDLELITYGLKWYDSISTAEVVRNYWVERINRDQAHDRCGFVYEAGELRHRYSGGNHIHIPSDYRVIHSPEYEEWYWICL